MIASFLYELIGSSHLAVRIYLKYQQNVCLYRTNAPNYRYITIMPQRATVVSLVSISIATLATTYLVSKYGVSGTLRYIWEGDHLPSEIRDELEKLESIQSKLRAQKKIINRITVLIETAKLNSVDEIIEREEESPVESDASGDDSSNQDVKRHYILSQVPSLSKDLGMLSYNLDSLAAKVDSVQSHDNEDVKKQKKDLSRKLVDMMKVCDGFMIDCGVDVS